MADMWTGAGLLWKEILLGARSLRRERAFTALSVVLLALGIGMASAVFTLLWQAVYAQLPVPNPSEVLTFSTNVTHMGRSDSDADAETFSVPTYRYLAAHFKAVEGTIARHGEYLNLETPGGSRHLPVDFVSGNFFHVLRVKTAIGQTLEERNDTFTDDRFTAVLSYDFWQDAFGGQLSAWNSVLRVNGIGFRVVGVAPPGFKGLVSGQAPKLFLPIAAYADVNPGWHGDEDWGLRWLNAFARLPAPSRRATAEAELQPIYHAAVREELAAEGMQSPEYLKELSHEHLSLVPASQGVHAELDSWGEPLRILQWMTLAILALAATNVAGLVVVRGLKQRREILIRYAVGASRSAVMRLHLLQTLLLSIAGGLLGLFVARWGAELLVHLARLDRGGALIYSPRGWALLLHWAGALATGFLVGVLPAWQAARVDLAGGISEGSVTNSGTRSQAFAKRSLAAAQIALSLTLAIAAGLFAQALHKLTSVPVGFNPQRLTVFSIDAKLAHSTVASTQLLYSNVARELKQTPGVVSVTYGMGGPFPQEADSIVMIPGTSSDSIPKHQSGTRSIIGANYFSTLGIPLLAGREIDASDRQNSSPVVMINQVLAHKLFGDTNAVVRTVTLFNGLDPNWQATIIGVAADHHQSWKRSGVSLVYTAAQQAQRITDMTYYVRTSEKALPERTIRELIRREAPGLSAYDIQTMQTRMAEFASGENAMAVLIEAFAALALLIAAVGIYGVVAYSASLRTLEFGVRIAVGANRSHVIGLVLREALGILLSGIALAVPLCYSGFFIVRNQLTGVAIREPWIYAGAVLLLALCCLLAAIVPARHAVRLSVSAVLRHQ